MKIIFLFLTIVLGAQSITSQGGVAPGQLGNSSNVAILRDIVNSNDNYGRVVMNNDRKNNRYSLNLFDNNGMVQIYVKSGKAYKIANTNYDLVSQQLFSTIDTDQLFSFDVSTIDYIIKENKKFIFIENSARPLHEEIISTEDWKLLKGFDIVKKEAMTNPLTNEITKPAHYVMKEKYFLKSDTKYIELPNKEKKFVRIFSEKENDIKTFIKKNDLSVKAEGDLVRIVQYASTL